MASSTNIWTLTLASHDDQTANQYLAQVVNATSGGADAAGAAAKVLGVLQNAPDTGQAASVQVHGQTKAITGAAVTLGAQVEVDANAKFIDLSAGEPVGIALEASAGADEIISVVLI